MTLPVPSLLARLTDATGKIRTPWNSWFQQFSSAPAAVNNIIVGASPFSITGNFAGNIIITGGTISSISLFRGTDFTDMTGQRVIPISIQDQVIITYTVVPVVKFFSFY